MEIKQNRRRELILAYAPLFLWIGVIFFLSSNSGSMNETSRFIEPIVRLLFPSASTEEIRQYHGIVRKCAHFTEYAILAFFAVRAFKVIARSYFKLAPFLIAIFLAAAVACADEFNQSFEASRTSSGLDVLLDIAGGATSLLVYFLVSRFFSASAPPTPESAS